MANDLNEADLEQLLNILINSNPPNKKNLTLKLKALRDSLILFDGTVTVVEFVDSWLDKKLGIYHAPSVREVRSDVTRVSTAEFAAIAGDAMEDNAALNKDIATDKEIDTALNTLLDKRVQKEASGEAAIEGVQTGKQNEQQIKDDMGYDYDASLFHGYVEDE